MASERERETDFLRQLIRYDDSAERDKLDERVAQIQRNEHCLRRAVSLMSALSALAMAGLYGALTFLADDPESKWRLPIKLMCWLGLASLISLVAFGGYWLAHRWELNRRRKECRRLVLNLLDLRLGKARSTPAPGPGHGPEIVIHQTEAVASPEIVKLSGAQTHR
jgi:hypothetical protein